MAKSADIKWGTSLLFVDLQFINTMILVESLPLGFSNSSAKIIIPSFHFYISTLRKISTVNDLLSGQSQMTTEQSTVSLNKRYDLMTD